MTFKKTLGEIVDLLYSFKESRSDLSVPDMSDGFTKRLYANYLSYLPANGFAYKLKMNKDDRGSFTEILRTADRGQVSVNISKPGITKGQHWHHTKNEKFVVVSGHGLIQLRKIGVDENGLITFADYNDSNDFREKYLINGDGEKLLLSWLIPYQDIKPEYQAEYDNVFVALSEEYSVAQRKLEDDLQSGLISVVDYYTQLEILEDEYSAKRDVLDVEWKNRSGVWGDVRVRVSGKNLTETPVDLYLVDMDYETGGYQLIGPIEFKSIDGWQSFIYRFDNGGKRYDHVNSGYPYHTEI